MSRAPLKRLGAPLLFVFLVAGCAEEVVPPRSAVLITLDTTRADALGSFGGKDGVTPALDALAAEGIRYGAAHTTAPLTLPAHSSMLTGLYPPRHGVRANGLVPLPATADTLAERAQAAGLETAAFVAAVVLDPAFGLDQGFEVYDAPRRAGARETTSYEERPGKEVVDGALAWLEQRDRSKRFFLWVHLFEPHGPYEPPPDLAGRFGRNDMGFYLGEVAAADREVGRLVDALRADGTLDETVVLVVADHGEAFGEHGELSHGAYVWQPTMQVPMILWHPDGYEAGRTEERLASVVDVAPTLAEALGIAPSPDGDGASLYRRRPPTDRGVYFESYDGFLSYGWSPLAGWVDEDGKTLFSSSPNHFDLAADPGEEEDLVEERAAVVERHRRALRAMLDRPALELDGEGGFDTDLVADLRKLGYTGLGSWGRELPDPLAPSELPSPNERVHEQVQSMRALELLNAGVYGPAERVYREILAGNPNNYYALDRLASCLVLQGRQADAIDPLQRLLADGPQWAGSWFNLGVCLRAVDRDDEAVAALRRAVELDPRQPIFREGLAVLLSDLGREDEARAILSGAPAEEGE